jgi:transglutaminase-like putative cysteine protease/predicted glutamine amidotransferase
MSQIVAFSLDCPSSPSVLLKLPTAREQNQSYGRGFAWYNVEELSTTVVKETKYADQPAFSTIMEDFTRFHSTIFIGHVRGAVKRLVQQDAQPFTRSYAGRDWVFVHSGDLQVGYKNHIPLEKDTFFEPIGSTDSEYIFCFLLEKFRVAGARSLADAGWQNILNWLTEVNAFGTANFIISDGLDVVVYHDKNAFNPLFYYRSCPPHKVTHFETPVFVIDLSSPLDLNHTFVIVGNENVNGACRPMQNGQMIVLRRGQVIWNSVETKQSTSGEIKTISLNQIEVKEHLVANHVISPDVSVIDYALMSERKKFSVLHETIYRYDHAVELSRHLFHLRPVNDHIQSVIEYKLSISANGQGEFFEDVFGNVATFFQINSPYTELIIKSESVVSIANHPIYHSDYLHKRRDIPLVWLPWQRQMMSPYLLPPELPESELIELTDFAMSFVKRNDYDLMKVLEDINQTIHRDFKYVPGVTSIATTPYDLYIMRRGVCQDFTNLFICLARLLNIPARYRTGYIHTASDYSNQIQSEGSHAWVELYLPFIGWFGFDPTNGCVVEQDHVRVACGRNFLDASPTTGTIFKGGGHEELFIQVKVLTL